MLKIQNKIYLYTGLALLLLFFPFVELNYLPLFFLTIINFAVFFLVINSSIRLKPTKLNLSLVVFCFSILFVGLYNSLSLFYEQNFFIFSFVDAKMYHEMSRQMAWMPFEESVSYYLESWEISDLGAVLIISTLYRIIESNLFYNFSNILIGVVSALGMFRIGLYFMSRRYAFLCALTFAISSYVIWFHASGLKESFMVLVVILFFDQFYMYLRSNKMTHIVYGTFLVSLLIFFRPVIIFFCLASIGIGIFLKKRTGKTTFLAIVTLLIVGVLIYPVLESSVLQYLRGGDLAMMVAAKEIEGMVKGSLPFTYAVNVLSQSIGPLPTFNPNIDPKLSFYSVGLYYRVLLGLPFWLGVYYVFKRKKRELYPLIFFAFMEIGALTLILEGLELRKSIPHFPVIYLVAFWFVYYSASLNQRSRYWIKKVLYSYGFIVTCTVFYWNFR